MATQRADVAIAGATVAGLVAARTLAEAGVRVAVVDPAPERPVPPTGAAVVSVGPLSHRIALHHGESVAVAYLHGLADAVADIAAFAAAHDVPVTAVPGWGVSIDGHLAFQLRHEARLLRLAGLRVDFTDAQPFRQDVRPMLSVAEQCVVEPVAYLAALRRAAVEAGAQLTTGSITRVRHDALVTDAGVVAADRLVDTIGVLPATVVPAVRGLTTSRRPVLTAPALPWRPEEGSGPITSVSIWMDSPLAELVALPETITLVGRAGGSQESLARWAAEHLGVTEARPGWIAIDESRDSLPVVGAVSALLPLWVARGFGPAPLAGATWGGKALAAALLDGRRSPAKPLRLLGDVAAHVRTRVGVLADPKQRVADVLAARGLSRRVSHTT